uniref:rho guanine nucleotide exchange factor 17-like isoform X3 n=1 Tax=Ciona intestinalis TaxID=7719 RepID=UPI00089DC7D4|nr:rho guanine nucleotide exchange factor 17-like isoform X3 [Ciona intestinalis]|eukprot:XP_026696639.1 rho guanine nucleotide exchange factor 17-like isoform X3 [Ciona intestinalis]
MPDKNENAKDENRSIIDNNRRLLARDMLSSVLPRSRGTSPARHTRSRRTGTDTTDGLKPTKVTGGGSPASVKKRLGARSESPIISEGGEVTIPGEEEFNIMFDTVRKLSRDSETMSINNYSKLVDAFSKTTGDAKRSEIKLKQTLNNIGGNHFATCEGKRANYNHTAESDRSRIVPDYITRVNESSKPNFASAKPSVKSAVQQKQEPDRAMAKRRRERSGRGARRQHLRLENGTSTADDSAVGQANQANAIKYLPTYIQPVVETPRQQHRTADYDIFQHKKHTYTTGSTANGRSSRKSFVDRQVARIGDNRLSSSSSSDNSSVEDSSTRSSTRPAKSVQDISDADSESQPGRRTRRNRLRNRANQQRPIHTPDYVIATPPRKVSDHGVGTSDISRQLANKVSSVNDRSPKTSEASDYMGKQYQSREKRPSVDSVGKISTSPRNFQPTTVQNLVEGRIDHSTPNEATVVPKVQPKLGRETGRRESREKLIISGKQISAPLEEVQKEGSPTQINSTNQSPNNPVSDVAVQSNKEQLKTKFGHAFNSSKPSEQVNSKTDQAKRDRRTSLNEADADADNEQVVHSQPMLKARKVSEDYWPRDEVTEKLLQSRSTHSSISSSKPSLMPVSEAPTSTEQSNEVHAMKESLGHKQSLVTVMHLPKETNLSDPQVLSSEPMFVKGSPCDKLKHNQDDSVLHVADVINAKQTTERNAAAQTPRTLVRGHSNSSEAQRNSSSSSNACHKHTRSQSTDSTASNPEAYTTLTKQVVSHKPPPTPVWSFEETDRKLRQYDKTLPSDASLNNTTVCNGTTTDSWASSNDAAVLQSELNDLTPTLRDISINGSPLYVAPKFASYSANKPASVQVSPHVRTTQAPVVCDDMARHAVVTSSSASGVSNNSSTISTSSRKSSVVSLSTALRKGSANSACSPPPPSTVEIDEGCYTEEDVTAKGSPMSAPFAHPGFTLGEDEILDKSEFQNGPSNNNRRRRKYSAAGHSGSDVSNESVRSLSDPIPVRGKDLVGTEDGAVDGSYIVSLNQHDTAETVPDRNSVSDLSLYSENTSLPDDASDKLVNEPEKRKEQEDHTLAVQGTKTGGKTIKKKSFSDPNANAVLTAGLIGSMNAEMESPALYNSSSEPALSEQTDELGELNQFHIYQSTKHSGNHTKDNVLPSSGIGDMTHSIEEMSKLLLAEHTVMSPRSARRNMTLKSRKRAQIEQMKSKETVPLNNFIQNELHIQIAASVDPVVEDIFEKEEEQFQQMYESMTGAIPEKMPVVHTRSCSEPVPMDKLENRLVQKASERGRRAGIVQAPSLNDVMGDNRIPPPTESPLKHTKQLSNSVDRIHSATLPRAAGSRGLGFQVDKLDMRKHVVRNLLETEESYVNSLRILYETYFKPLKQPENHVVCEPRLVDEMFFQIPQILQHHEKFFENVEECFENWDPESVKIGDVFIQSFNKDMLLEAYTSYIKNFLNAREAVTIATQAKTAFKLFLEQCQRENRDKQGLSDLMIKPVQRIPRYELIIKDLLKHTPEDHADRTSLLIAQREIHALSVQMNKGEKEAEAAERHAKLLQDIEQIIEGCMEISGITKRRFLRQDICIELKSGNKKDRSLWLFNDLLMCTTSKKGRTGSLRRSSMNLWSMTTDRIMVDFTSKYKFLWKFPLEDVELLKGSTGPNRQVTEKQLQQLRCDHDLLIQMEKLASDLSTSHLLLDEAVKDLLSQTSQKIIEKQQMTMHGVGLPGRLEIGISTPDGMKMFQFEFQSEDNKTQFEVLFWNAKKNFNPQKSRWDPTFMKAIPISKTRNGMQFSCAAPNVDTSPGTREVWVCNTDGYVGQICFLSIEPETLPTKSITVCNSKICCIAQVPTWDRKLVPTNTFVNDISKAPLIHLPHGRRRSSTHSNPAHKIIAWDDTDDSDEDNTSPFSTNSNYSSYSMSPYSTNNSMSNFGQSTKERTSWSIHSSDEEIILPIMSPLLPSAFLPKGFGFGEPPAYVPSDEESDISLSTNDGSLLGDHGSRAPTNSLMHALLGSGAFKKDSDGSTLHGSLEDLLSDSTSSMTKHPPLAGKNSMGSKMLSNHGSMWLGTEDGKIKVYSTAEAIKGNKQCVHLNHNASVQCILHRDGQVYVALSNGDLIIYFRDKATGHWDFDNKKSISLGTSPNPITRMLVVNEKELWCGCQNQIMILDMKTHNVKSFFAVSQDSKRQIFCMVSSGYGVWVALDRRSQIKLFHSVTHDLLAEVDVSHPVSKMLASSDAIIRQHKAACLRITSLLVCKDLLWVGTSAGVVLTLALPSVTASTSSLSLPIIPQGLTYGHTGHVRFITSVDVMEKETPPQRGSRRSSSTKRRSSSASTSSQTRSNTIIISGGDGYEDFRMNSASEAAGREDSTNHLLLWKT